MSKVFNYLFELAFISIVARTLILGSGIGEAIGLVAIVAGMAYVRFLNKEKVVASDELINKVEEMATSIQSLQMDRMIKRIKTDEQKQKDPNKRYF